MSLSETELQQLLLRKQDQVLALTLRLREREELVRCCEALRRELSDQEQRIQEWLALAAGELRSRLDQQLQRDTLVLQIQLNEFRRRLEASEARADGSPKAQVDQARR